jgi:hypothetical protein
MPVFAKAVPRLAQEFKVVKVDGVAPDLPAALRSDCSG